MIKIGIISPIFRQTRKTFEQFEKMFSPSDAVKITKSSGVFSIITSLLEIHALPVDKKLRGYKFNHIFLGARELWDKEKWNEIVAPMISASSADIYELSPESTEFKKVDYEELNNWCQKNTQSWSDLDDGCQGNL